MLNLKVHGRGKPRATLIVDAEAVTVRLDSRIDPQFWAEVPLTRSILRGMLAELTRAEGVSCEFCPNQGGGCIVCEDY